MRKIIASIVLSSFVLGAGATAFAGTLPSTGATSKKVTTHKNIVKTKKYAKKVHTKNVNKKK